MNTKSQKVSEEKQQQPKGAKDKQSNASKIAAKNHALLHGARTKLSANVEDVAGCFDVKDGQLDQQPTKKDAK